jgi:hypothetical protein
MTAPEPNREAEKTTKKDLTACFAAVTQKAQ